LEKDTILVCHDNMVKVVNLQGKLKSSKRQASELHFDFSISCIVCLTDSVLAFHRQGMQGRSFKNNEVTQEICDRSRIFKLVGSDRIITIQSSPPTLGSTSTSSLATRPCNSEANANAKWWNLSLTDFFWTRQMALITFELWRSVPFSISILETFNINDHCMWQKNTIGQEFKWLNHENKTTISDIPLRFRHINNHYVNISVPSKSFL